MVTIDFEPEAAIGNPLVAGSSPVEIVQLADLLLRIVRRAEARMSTLTPVTKVGVDSLIE